MDFLQCKAFSSLFSQNIIISDSYTGYILETIPMKMLLFQTKFTLMANVALHSNTYYHKALLSKKALCHFYLVWMFLLK